MSNKCYYPFGMVIEERCNSHGDYRLGFNGMEKDDAVNGSGNCLNFGARIYDSRAGRWFSVDPSFKDYPESSPFGFVLGSPIQAIDPDGKKTYFLAGGSYRGKGNYNAFTGKFVETMTRVLGNDFQVVNSGHKGLISNLWKGRQYAFEPKTDPMDDKRIRRVVNEIRNDYLNNHQGELLNIIGASYGGMLGAQVAIALLEDTENGIERINNIIVSRSAMSQDAETYKRLLKLEEDGLIGRVHYEDEAYNDPEDGTVGLLGTEKKGSMKRYLKSYVDGSGRKHAENAKNPEQGLKMARRALVDHHIEGEDIQNCADVEIQQMEKMKNKKSESKLK